MEAPRRRLSILSSHLHPAPRETQCYNSSLSPSNCDSGKLNTEDNCIFCKIIRGESPALKLYEDDTCLCILDTNPVSPGHSLIIPRCHFSSLAATPPSVIGAMCSKVPYISNAIMKATDSDSFNLLVNNGVPAGQVIFHTHIHIIPRKARDYLWASESLRRCPLKLDNEARHLVDNIKEQLSCADAFSDSKNQGTSLMLSRE